MKKKFIKSSTKFLVVVDTNVFISAYLWGGKPKEIIDLWLSGQIRLLISLQLTSEVLLVLTRFKYSKEELNRLQKAFKEQAIIIFPKRTTNICRDSKDNFILDLCLAGKADFLITGDQDLLALKKFHQTHILKPKEFLKIYH